MNNTHNYSFLSNIESQEPTQTQHYAFEKGGTIRNSETILQKNGNHDPSARSNYFDEQQK